MFLAASARSDALGAALPRGMEKRASAVIRSSRDVYRLAMGLKTASERLRRPEYVVAGAVDPATAKLLLVDFDTYDAEKLVSIVGAQGAACPLLLTKLCEDATLLLTYRLCHVMPSCVRPGIAKALESTGGDALARSVLETSVVSSCEEKIKSILAGENGEAFLYAQLLGSVDSIWSAAKKADAELPELLANIRKRLQTHTSSSGRGRVMLPPHTVQHNVRVYHTVDGTHAVLKVQVPGGLTDVKLRAALDQSPYESVREYYKGHKLNDGLFLHCGTYAKYQAVEAIPHRPFSARFEAPDVGNKIRTKAPVNMARCIRAVWKSFRESPNKDEERAAAVTLVVDGVEKLNVKKSFMKLVEGEDGKRSKRVCSEKRGRFIKYMECKMLKRISNCTDNPRYISTYVMKLTTTLNASAKKKAKTA